VKVLKALVNEASTTGKILKPQVIMTDFESAAIKAFKQVFSEIISKGCMFHLGQNFMKRLGSIGLKTRYSEDLTFNRWINSVFGLALCPVNLIATQFAKCLEDKPDVPRIDEFLDYVVANYFEGKSFHNVPLLATIHQNSVDFQVNFQWKCGTTLIIRNGRGPTTVSKLTMLN
jgi:hypothetical protein